MTKQAPFAVSVFDLLLCISKVVDLVSPLVADHHKRTAQIAYWLGVQMKLPQSELRDLVTAALIHDVGALTRRDRLVTMDFEFQDPYGHSVMGCLLLKSFTPFRPQAEIVRFHHVPWRHGKGSVFDGAPVPRASHILHLADRVAVLIDGNGDVLEQADNIMAKIKSQSGERFVPAHVKALVAVSKKESFWLDAIFLQRLSVLHQRLKWKDLGINGDQFLELTHLFRRIIDFRSQFTAAHSAGVAAAAETLARLCGFSAQDCRLMHLAGLMHDLGKLSIPAEILEKPGRLTHEEFAVMRRHTYHTFQLLEPLKVFDVVRVWAAFHHERMDGKGYPFHLGQKELPLGSRIVSVADVFTALTEDRPYRKAMNVEDAYKIVAQCALQHQLDRHVVAVLHVNREEVKRACCSAQKEALAEYREFIATAGTLIRHPDGRKTRAGAGR